MSSGLPLSEVGSLVGDPARANILSALLDGRALNASELARVAGVSPATAIEHLAKLVAGALLTVVRQGRHRSFRLASGEVAAMLESMMVVAIRDPTPSARLRATPRIDPALREARTCYDHLAGRLGVGIADALLARGALVLGPDAGEITPAGRALFETFGVTIDPMGRGRRPLCKPCLDWSERRPHLAGVLGKAICERCLELGWIRRDRGTRAVSVTAEGKRGFADTFGVTLA